MSTDQAQQRRRNLEALVALGVDPYPRRYDVTHHAAPVLEGFETLAAQGAAVSLAGRILALRGHGKTTFAHLQDESGRIQLYFKRDVLGDAAYEIVKLLDLGDHVGVRGPLFRTKMGEITIEVRELVFLSKCLRPLPEKWHGLKDTEIRYRQRYLDLVVNAEARRIFRVRAAIIRSLRATLDARGYLEVDTPVLQPLYGGAFARPFVTHHQALDMELYLRISNELYLKRLIVGGFERVYEIARDFRNEGIDRSHNPEFSMLEYYEAYADLGDMMALTEEMVSRAITESTGSASTTYRDDTLDFTPPWRRVRYHDALREATGADLLGAPEARLRETAKRLNVDVEGKLGGGQIVDALFSETVQPGLVQPTFVTDFPRELSPLARVHRGDDRLVERFELFAGGMELANAFTEQNDPQAQLQAFEAQAQLREQGDMEAQMTDHDFLRALETGMPPTGGVGIGLDRLVMVATGAANIREVILFPQLRPEVGDGEEPTPPPPSLQFGWIQTSLEDEDWENFLIPQVVSYQQLPTVFQDLEKLPAMLGGNTTLQHPMRQSEFRIVASKSSLGVTCWLSGVTKGDPNSAIDQPPLAVAFKSNDASISGYLIQSKVKLDQSSLPPKDFYDHIAELAANTDPTSIYWKHVLEAIESLKKQSR